MTLLFGVIFIYSEQYRKYFYVSGTDAATEGVWLTHDGQPLPWLEYDNGYDRNSDEQDCLVLRAWVGEDGLRADYCDDSEYVLREKIGKY